MAIHNINIHSQVDCEELINRIIGTLASVKPHILVGIDHNHYPGHFIRNDTHIFEHLTGAVLSSGVKSKKLERYLPIIKRILHNYDINAISGLSDSQIDTLFENQIKPLRIPWGKWHQPITKIKWIRDNATVFREIQKRHDSVWHFIETNLEGAPFNDAHGCYIHPNDDLLLKCFTAKPYKLKGVQLAICCEFFNNIGIDEFKPDRHTIRFLNRVRIVRSPSPDGVRKAGITIAETLRQPRKFVDSHIWFFCADGQGDICVGTNPKCNLCWLKTRQPQLCEGE